jgi:Kae1-associated kinase Bud32
MKSKPLYQGAEAKIYLETRTDSPIIIKDRVPKFYRHPQLDEKIRNRRCRHEKKIMDKAYFVGANIPRITFRDSVSNILYIEFIKGDRLSETLNTYPEKKQFQIMQQLGKQIALLHANNIIHGDLTTSNTILSGNKLFIIDFGLGFISTKIEDKAVDLHLIKQALEAKHFRSPDHLRGQNHQDLFQHFTKGYIHQDSKKITERLIIVEKRGRYKHQNP